MSAALLARGADMYLGINETKGDKSDIKETIELQEAEMSEERKDKKTMAICCRS